MRNAEELKRIEGLEYIASAPEGETIIGLCAKDDKLFVATDRHLYFLVSDKRLEKYIE